jgi:predicted ATPase/DNA-binding SARP family transcriptional activator
VEFRLLGPLEVVEGDRPLGLGGAKQRALLADLLVHANRVVSMDRLIDDLWAEEPPATAPGVVQTMVAQLRKVLEPQRGRGAPSALLELVAPGYRLRVRPGELDVDRFDALVSEGRAVLASDPAGAAERLRLALRLWRGPALADVAEEPWARAAATRLEERRLVATEDRVDAELALGRHADLVGELEALVSQHPLRERLGGQLILALYRSGRQAEASAVFHRTRERLADELGMEPGPELQRLFRQILNQDPALQGTPAAPEPERERTNLPIPLTRLVGRTQEVATLRDLVARCRLLTLTGAGGIGKTRLALETAARAAEDHPDGVWLVELGAVSDAAALPMLVLSTLRQRSHYGLSALDTLVSALRPQRCLLVLDNCEHLVEACAQLAETILGRCPELRILATSREVLGVSGETTWRVPSLPTPALEPPVSARRIAECAAVQLFLERAAAGGGHFELSDANAPAVARVCRRLDGIPLAIELAAARLRVMPITAIDERLADRFEILSGGGRRSVPRQRTLEATLDWSHDLLAAGERTLFRRLGIFAGGWDLDAATDVCTAPDLPAPEVLDLLASLVDKSLVTVEEGVEGRGRYRLLEPIRQYAAARLDREGERSALAGRHAAHYLRLGDRAEEGLRGPRAALWIRRVEEELDNLRAAFAWALENDPPAALRLAADLFRFWRLDRQTEGSAWIGRALDTGTAGDEMRAQALRGGCWLALLAGRHDEARLLGRECLAIGERRQSSLLRGWALHALGIVELFAGDTRRAVALLGEAEPSLREARDATWLGSMLNDLGNCLLHDGNPVEARARVEEAVTLARAAEDPWMLGIYTESLAQVEFSLGDLVAARSHWLESLRLGGEFRSRFTVHYALIGLARVALAEAQPDRCLRLLGAATEAGRRMGLAVEPPIERIVAATRAGAESSLDPAAAALAWAEGTALSLDEAVRWGGQGPIAALASL